MRPNLLIVLCDQLRRHALGAYGDPHQGTPHLDALADRGATFQHACSTYPICVPFRFTMMTGEYAHSRMIPGIEWRMSPRERTLADEFNEAGYETLYVGKWHLYGGHLHMPGYGARHEGVKPVPPLYQGRWNHWRGFELRNSPFDTYYFIDDDPTPHKIDGYQTDGLFDITMGLLRDQRDESKPFCCVLSVEPPHPPYEAPADLEEKWLNTELDLPPNFMVSPEDPYLEKMNVHQLGAPHREAILRERQIYHAMVENLDQNMGRLQSFLVENDLIDNTIVVFLSDHGEMNGAHCMHSKQNPYEESCGIPLLISGPGIAAGQRVADPVATEDLFPTFLGLAGLPPRTDLPGMDASPLIRDEASSLDRPGVMLQFVSELRPDQPYYACCYRGFRSRRYKYTVAGDLTGYQPWQFFDLQEDPWELHNLIHSESHQEEIAAHHQALYARMLESQDDATLAPAYGCPAVNLEWQPAD